MSGEYRTIVADPPWALGWNMRVGTGRAGVAVELFARRARLGWDTWGNESLGTAEMPEAA